MVGIKKLYGILIIKDSARFIERNAMLFDISLILPTVLFKPELVHMYIVLIIVCKSRLIF